MKAFRLELGTVVKSNISGFKGMITSRSEHINGCDRYWIQPPVDKDGKVVEGSWMDDQELVVVKKAVVVKDLKDKRGGFPSKTK